MNDTTDPKPITIARPDESTVLAARHLDLTEGPVQVGVTVDTATRGAITTVLRYIATAHNSPAAPDLEDQLDGAYRERAQLLGLLASLHPSVIAPAPDVNEPGWQILYLRIGGRQASWHIAPGDADLFAHVEHVPFDDGRAQWDGHTTEEKYAHIGEHAARLYAEARGRIETPQAPAEGEAAGPRRTLMLNCSTCGATGITVWADHVNACTGIGEIQLTRHLGRGVIVETAPPRTRIALTLLTNSSCMLAMRSTDEISIADQVLYRVTGYDPGTASLIVELVEDWRPVPTVKLTEADVKNVEARWREMHGRPGAAHPVTEVSDATACTPIPAATLMQLSEVPPQLRPDPARKEPS